MTLATLSMLGYIDADETNHKASEVLWPHNPADDNAENWRKKHKNALSLLLNGQAMTTRSRCEILLHQARELTQLVQSLVQRKPFDLIMGEAADPQDRRFVFGTLGKLLAQKEKWFDERDFDPRIYVLNDLFQYWTRRGCEGANVAQAGSLEIRWITHPAMGQRISDHWMNALSSQACFGLNHLDEQIKLLHPWKVLRADMKIFLDGWNSQFPSLEIVDDQTVGRNCLNLTRIGVCCRAIRMMGTVTPRRLTSTTAGQLHKLEVWAGPGGVKLEAEQVRIQQAAWDRHLLEAVVRDTRKQKIKGTAVDEKQETSVLPKTGRRKM